MSENASEETTIDGEIINHFEKHGIDEFKELDNYGIIDGIVRSLDDKDNPLKFSNTRKWVSYNFATFDLALWHSTQNHTMLL